MEGVSGVEHEVSPEVLLYCLAAAVPLWRERARGWDDDRLHAEAQRCGDIIAHGADSLFRHDPRFSKKDLHLPTVVDLTAEQHKGGTFARGYRPAEIFNAFAEAIGIGSLVPGGVDFMGAHWCSAPHKGCPNRRAT